MSSPNIVTIASPHAVAALPGADILTQLTLSWVMSTLPQLLGAIVHLGNQGYGPQVKAALMSTAPQFRSAIYPDDRRDFDAFIHTYLVGDLAP